MVFFVSLAFVYLCTKFGAVGILGERGRGWGEGCRGAGCAVFLADMWIYVVRSRLDSVGFELNVCGRLEDVAFSSRHAFNPREGTNQLPVAVQCAYEKGGGRLFP